MKVKDSHKWKCFRFVFKDTFAGLSEHWPHPQVVLCVADLPLLGEGREGISLQSCCHVCIQMPTCHYSLSAAGIDWQCCHISKRLMWQTEEHLCIDIHCEWLSHFQWYCKNWFLKRKWLKKWLNFVFKSYMNKCTKFH